MKAPAIAGLILSGGASRRMGVPKALLTLEGETFLDQLIRAFSTVCCRTVVVLGHGAERIEAGTARSREVLFCTNPDPERGMLSSLQCGLSALAPAPDAVIFTPVDYPNIQHSTIEQLAQAFALHAAPVTIPVHDRERGHPVCISREIIEQLLGLPTEAQARDVLRANRHLTHFVEVSDPGILADIDYPEDYRRLTAQSEVA